MTGGLETRVDGAGHVGKHPVVETIEEVFSFRLQRLVAVEERVAQGRTLRFFDLSTNEWRLLALVQGRAPARARALADLLLMDKSQTSRVVKSLLAKGLLFTSPDPDDGRASVLELTGKGAKLYMRAFAEVMRNNQRMLEVLSVEEVLAFDLILAKLTGRCCDLLDARLKRRLTR
ncbi:MarR family winged helix-turn-helix transcriptional regulator [Sulfitobacter sp. F26204]|uniref:MarR family winged helix-turn-helix transcriptional regulator n=1 Tax=Sulfitobacter sp. F26204 TaxID=2996014 RepID=UPI00225DD758|nr:MarR family winged helix-turn-helix transcriptional regulator [Sulfitobacter sp. F26204]MCX7558514.1 MarR family winged helix-turn-helix transcriptional regulator [Sulfitobacter sp. F26204]